MISASSFSYAITGRDKSAASRRRRPLSSILHFTNSSKNGLSIFIDWLRSTRDNSSRTRTSAYAATAPFHARTSAKAVDRLVARLKHRLVLAVGSPCLCFLGRRGTQLVRLVACPSTAILQPRAKIDLPDRYRDRQVFKGRRQTRKFFGKLAFELCDRLRIESATGRST